jgi:3-dehydroquinate dehydratase
LLSPLFGAFFTFASLEQGSETASGQMSIQEMRTAYELLGEK